MSAAGDVNGDGYADMIIGVHKGDPGFANNANNPGQAAVVFGGPNLSSVVAPTLTGANTTSGFDLGSLAGSDGFKLNGGNNGAVQQQFMGSGVSAADLNGDGYNDLAVLAQQQNGGSNLLAIVAGDTTADLNAQLPGTSTTTGFNLTGTTSAFNANLTVAGAGLGFLPLAGAQVQDLNSDGRKELLVGDYTVGGGNGAAYMMFGSSMANLDARNLNTTNFSGTILKFIGPGGAFEAGIAYAVYGDNLSGYSTAGVGTLGAPSTAAGPNTTVVGSPGNDVLSSGVHNGVVLLGGAGSQDTFIVNGNERKVSGNGLAALNLFNEAAGYDLDFNNLVAHPQDQYTGINTIGMRGTGSNTLTLDAADVLDLSTLNHRLLVIGDASDFVVSTGQGWTQGGDQTIGAVTYHTYSIANSAAQLLVDTTIPLLNLNIT